MCRASPRETPEALQQGALETTCSEWRYCTLWQMRKLRPPKVSGLLQPQSWVDSACPSPHQACASTTCQTEDPLTARTSSGRSSSSSPLTTFSRVLMEISRSFSWWWFSRSRHWAMVQLRVKQKSVQRAGGLASCWSLSLDESRLLRTKGKLWGAVHRGLHSCLPTQTSPQASLTPCPIHIPASH